MKHPLLDSHHKIAWDMDETLVNGPNSEFFRQYIAAHPEKEHYIVTFRTGDAWIADIPFELADEGLNPDLIKAVSSVPMKIWIERHLSRVHMAVCNDWKGFEAKRLGCTVLVDDMEASVLPGCEKHGITFIHSIETEFPQLKPQGDGIRPWLESVCAAFPAEALPEVTKAPLMEWYSEQVSVTEAVERLRTRTGY
jgi:hypothetical protein